MELNWIGLDECVTNHCGDVTPKKKKKELILAIKVKDKSDDGFRSSEHESSFNSHLKSPTYTHALLYI